MWKVAHHLSTTIVEDYDKWQCGVVWSFVGNIKLPLTRLEEVNRATFERW
jgi:hypothetical protein